MNITSMLQRKQKKKKKRQREDGINSSFPFSARPVVFNLLTIPRFRQQTENVNEGEKTF